MPANTSSKAKRTRKSTKKQLPEGTPKPRSAYLQFSLALRPQLAASKWPAKDILAECGRKWKLLSAEEKEPYEAEYASQMLAKKHFLEEYARGKVASTPTRHGPKEADAPSGKDDSTSDADEASEVGQSTQEADSASSMPAGTQEADPSSETCTPGSEMPVDTPTSIPCLRPMCVLPGYLCVTCLVTPLTGVSGNVHYCKFHMGAHNSWFPVLYALAGRVPLCCLLLCCGGPAKTTYIRINL